MSLLSYKILQVIRGQFTMALRKNTKKLAIIG